jgi:hypothetical protein
MVFIKCSNWVCSKDFFFNILILIEVYLFSNLFLIDRVPQRSNDGQVKKDFLKNSFRVLEILAKFISNFSWVNGDNRRRK